MAFLSCYVLQSEALIPPLFLIFFLAGKWSRTHPQRSFVWSFLSRQAYPFFPIYRHHLNWGEKRPDEQSKNKRCCSLDWILNLLQQELVDNGIKCKKHHIKIVSTLQNLFALLLHVTLNDRPIYSQEQLVIIIRSKIKDYKRTRRSPPTPPTKLTDTPEKKKRNPTRRKDRNLNSFHSAYS